MSPLDDEGRLAIHAELFVAGSTPSKTALLGRIVGAAIDP
jgi:hypothetical protein